MHRALLLMVLSLSILLSSLGTAQDASYTFTSIDVPGAWSTGAAGINNKGQIVGEFTDATGTHGFLKDGARFTPIDVPGVLYTWAEGINNEGQIIGSFLDGPVEIPGGGPPVYLPHGFLKDGDTFTTIDVPGALYTRANGINNEGLIVGSFSNAEIDPHDPDYHVFVTDGTTFTFMNVPHVYWTYARGINDSGAIVGNFYLSYYPEYFYDESDGFVAIPE